MELDWLRHEFVELEHAIQQWLEEGLAEAKRELAQFDADGDGQVDGDMSRVATHGGLGLTRETARTKAFDTGNSNKDLAYSLAGQSASQRTLALKVRRRRRRRRPRRTAAIA